MPSDSALQVQVKVGTDGLIKGLKISTDSVADAAELMRQSLAKIGDSSGETKTKHEGLISSLRDFKSEATQNSRVARFFANDLMAMVPGADGASGALRKLIGIGLGGASIFTAIELGVFLVEQLNEYLKETEKHAQELTDAYNKTARSAQAALESVERGLHPVTATQRAWGDEVRKVREENQKLDDQIAKLLSKSGGVRDFIGYLGSALTAGSAFTPGHGDVTSSIDDQIKKLNELKEANLQGLESKRPKKEEVGKEESTKRDHDAALAAANDRERIEVDLQAKLRSLSLVGATQEQQIQAQLATDVERLKLESDVATRDNQLKNEKEADAGVRAINNATLAEKKKAIDDEIKALEEAAKKKIALAARTKDQSRYDEQVKSFREIADLTDRENALQLARQDKHLAEQLLRIKQEADRETDVLDRAHETGIISEEQYQARLARVQKTAAEQRNEALVKAREKDIKAFVTPFENAFAASLRNLVDGTKSFTQALDEMLKGLLGALIDGLVKVGIAAVESAIIGATANKAETESMVIGSAAAGGAAAAAAAAPFFFWNPGAAVAIGAAMDAAIAGAFTVASAAGGMDIPAGVNPLVQLHEKEMVIPAPVADHIRTSMSAGGGSGGAVHLHFHGPADGNSIAAFVKSDGFVRAMRDMQRTGRL